MYSVSTQGVIKHIINVYYHQANKLYHKIKLKSKSFCLPPLFSTQKFIIKGGCSLYSRQLISSDPSVQS